MSFGRRIGEAALGIALAVGAARGVEAKTPGKPGPEKPAASSTKHEVALAQSAERIVLVEKELHFDGNLVLSEQPDLSQAQVEGKYLVGENFVAYPLPAIKSIGLARNSAGGRLRTFIVQKGFSTSNVPQFMEKDGVPYVYMGIAK